MIRPSTAWWALWAFVRVCSYSILNDFSTAAQADPQFGWHEPQQVPWAWLQASYGSRQTRRLSVIFTSLWVQQGIKYALGEGYLGVAASLWPKRVRSRLFDLFWHMCFLLSYWNIPVPCYDYFVAQDFARINVALSFPRCLAISPIFLLEIVENIFAY